MMIELSIWPSRPCRQTLWCLIGRVQSENQFRCACKMVGGLWETASEDFCHVPGQCWMVYLYLRVFSFSLNNVGGGWILPRSLYPNSPFSGSWNHNKVRETHYKYPTLLQCPRNCCCLGLERCVYLHSASMQNLLPANIRRQPSGQQTGSLSVVHMQYILQQ